MYVVLFGDGGDANHLSEYIKSGDIKNNGLAKEEEVGGLFCQSRYDKRGDSGCGNGDNNSQ